MTTPNPALAPYVPTYATRVPYITATQYMNEPTGVDVSQLVPGADAPTNLAALKRVIARASSRADVICRQVLAATLDVQSGAYRVRSDGAIHVPVDNTPLVEVTNVAVGVQPGRLTALTDLSGLWLQRKTVWVPLTNLSMLWSGSTASATAGAGRVFAQVSYVNGWAVTTLAAGALVNASSLTLSSALGVFPGLQMNVTDGSVSEVVTVAATYVQGSTAVPLVSPLSAAHAAGTAVSALPGAITEAVSLLTSALIKVRGAESMAMASVTGGPTKQQNEGEPGASVEYGEALEILKPFRRVW